MHRQNIADTFLGYFSECLNRTSGWNTSTVNVTVHLTGIPPSCLHSSMGLCWMLAPPTPLCISTNGQQRRTTTLEELNRPTPAKSQVRMRHNHVQYQGEVCHVSEHTLIY